MKTTELIAVARKCGDRTTNCERECPMYGKGESCTTRLLNALADRLEEVTRMKAISENKFYKGLIESEEEYENIKNGLADWKAHIKPKIKSVIIPYDLFLRLMDADKKRTPKKVKAEKYMYGKTYHCPNCNIFVGYNNDLSLPKYCKCCGQALSYDEVQENEK